MPRPRRLRAVLLAVGVVGLLGCGSKPSPTRAIPETQKVRAMFMEMLETEYLSKQDPSYRRMCRLGPPAVPELEQIARDTSIHFRFIAYSIIGEIGRKTHDKSAAPFLIDSMENDPTEEGRMNAVWGLDCILHLGRFNRGDPEAEEIRGRYRRWWATHKTEFPER